MTDTIAAVASASGPARRAVLRVSGPRAAAVGSACCTGADGAPVDLAERGAREVRFHDGVGELPCLAVWMPGPRSFTAEDVLELHLPGQPDLVRGALERVLAAGARLAEPGEFTRRAFENGRMDLTRAEGVLALVRARSEGERRAASALLAGGLETRLAAVRAQLEAVRALTEASLDFDEADTGHVPEPELLEMSRRACAALDEALGWERSRAADGGALRVVLAGAPNAGKSTLFNRLASGAAAEASGAALVSDLEGTTRDAKRARWDLGGALAGAGPCELVDTAGVRPRAVDHRAADDPDRIAEARAAGLAGAADLVIAVVDASAPAEELPVDKLPVDQLSVEGCLVAWNKVDLPSAAPAPPAALVERAAGWVAVSAATGAGLDDLAGAAAERLAGGAEDGASVGALGLAARHLRSLEEARAGVNRALEALQAPGVPLDQAAEELRVATDALDGIAGRTTPEDLLDRIFAQFCLGK